jgi:hypothetical protein
MHTTTPYGELLFSIVGAACSLGSKSRDRPAINKASGSIMDD